MYNELTEVDIRKMQEEIDYRTKVVRPKCVEDLATAAAFGDRSENYEYKAAKQELRRCDSRLRYLRRIATPTTLSPFNVYATLSSQAAFIPLPLSTLFCLW